jgi:Secretion system C-terminal sorting domain
MKHSYTKFFTLTLFVLFIACCGSKTYAQTVCVDSSISGGVAFDTTIVTPPGINSMQLQFPKFDPALGMVTCVKLCISITGVVDSVSVENNSASSQTADVFYIRTDQLTGPGLAGPLTNSINHHYGPFSLGATDGTLGSGPDFVSISRDTLLNAVTICQPINDSAALSNFYGHDSVTYTYDITAFTNVSCTGGNYNSTVATSAFVNFHFQYCICPIAVLPLSVHEFFAKKISPDQAELSWTGFDDPNKNYRYEVELSHDGYHFSSIGTIAKNTSSENNIYKFLYTSGSSASGVYFFRIKQVYSNGYTRFSEIRSIELEKSAIPKFSIYPNPSSGIVGIKFDNYQDGKMIIQVFNTHGQKVVQKEIVSPGSSYQQIATLQSGVYWLKLTDIAGQVSSVNQLIIK